MSAIERAADRIMPICYHFTDYGKEVARRAIVAAISDAITEEVRKEGDLLRQNVRELHELLQAAWGERDAAREAVRKAIAWNEFTDEQMDELAKMAGIGLTTPELPRYQP